jgi:hypothetical protein
MRFQPTINEENPVGGSTSFGAGSFSPQISNIVITDAKVIGTFQKLGQMVFFAITFIADAGTVSTTSSIFTPPHTVSPYFRGWLRQGSAMINQAADGTFQINNVTLNNSRLYITGYYWV